MPTIYSNLYSIRQNVPYGPGPNQVCDLYVPRKLIDPAPILMIHGGGFVRGTEDKKEIVVNAKALASQGFLCVGIRYTLSNPAQAIADCQLCVQWVRANVALYQPAASGQFLVGLGGSAGGTLVQELAIAGVAGDSKVDVAVSLSGPSTNTLPIPNGTDQMMPDPGPADLDLSNVCPLFIYNSAAEVIPANQAQYLYDKLLEAGYLPPHVQLRIVLGSKHAFAYWSVVKPEAMAWIAARLAELRA